MTAEPILLPTAAGVNHPDTTAVTLFRSITTETTTDKATDPTAEAVNTLHRRIVGHDWQSLMLTIQCGKMLAEKRDSLKNKFFPDAEDEEADKKFSKWVNANCTFTRSTAYYRMDLANCPAVQQRLESLDPTKDEPPSGRRLMKLVMEERRHDKRKKHIGDLPTVTDPNIGVHLCDCRELPVEPGTANVVVIDPPWDKPTVASGIYQTAAELAAKWLRPGGFALVYVSHDSLPEVVAQTGKHLTYCWPLVLGYGKNRNGYRLDRFKTAHRIILLYSNGKPAPAPAKEWVHDLYLTTYDNAEVTKDWHKWQQNSQGLGVFLSALSDPGDLIVDPFAGGGTTAAVVKGLGGRHVITGDIDPKAVDTVNARLNKLAKAKVKVK